MNEYILDDETLVFNEPNTMYEGKKFLYKDETHQIIGACMEVHNILGRGFMEAIYCDALECEFKFCDINYSREELYEIEYKNQILKHKFRVDFLIFNKIVLEVKATNKEIESHYKQVLNYLAVTKLPVGLVVNFGEDKLQFKRIVL